MHDWIFNNWKEVLGSGGIGVIIVALINYYSKNRSGERTKQKIKSGRNSENYQANGNITINDRKKVKNNGK